MKCEYCDKDLEKYSFNVCIDCRLSIRSVPGGKPYNETYRTLKIKGQKLVFYRNYYWAYNILKYGTSYFSKDLKFKLYLEKKKHYKPKKSDRLQGFNALRERVRIRDNHTCQMCGKIWIKDQRRLDVHHLDIEREGKKDYQYDKNNPHMMITYCHKCHYSLHTVRKKLSDGQHRYLERASNKTHISTSYKE